MYRLYDEAGSLLYVGASSTPAARLMEHRDKAWWPAIDSMTVEQFNSRREALVAETAAIGSERPRYNRRRSIDSDPVRTVRVSDEDWNAAQDRVWELRDRYVFHDYLRLAVRAFAKDPAAARAALEEIEGEEA